MIAEFKNRWPALFLECEVLKIYCLNLPIILHPYVVIIITNKKQMYLFCLNVFQLNAEFLRITTKPLQSKFMSQLDHFSDKLI